MGLKTVIPIVMDQWGLDMLIEDSVQKAERGLRDLVVLSSPIHHVAWRSSYWLEGVGPGFSFKESQEIGELGWYLSKLLNLL